MPHQHTQRTQSHDAIAQTHAQGRAHHGLYQGGIGTQARQHLTGWGVFKKCGTLLQHPVVDGLAQVGRDALTQPAHHVEPR